jgi:hypothetical protein
MGLSAVESQLNLVDTILVRLANEGVPVRAIARSTRLPSADIYDRLTEAVWAGELLAIPRDDWPPLVARGDRLPGFPPLTEQDDGALILHLVNCFRLTRLQAILLLQFIKRQEVNREQLHQAIEARRPPTEKRSESKLVDVVLWALCKKLKPMFGEDVIVTVRGCGYTMPRAHRKRITAMLGEYLGIELEAAEHRRAQNSCTSVDLFVDASGAIFPNH